MAEPNTNALQKTRGGTSAFVNAALPQLWPLPTSDFAFSSEMELTFAINRIILNPVNLKFKSDYLPEKTLRRTW